MRLEIVPRWLSGVLHFGSIIKAQQPLINQERLLCFFIASDYLSSVLICSVRLIGTPDGETIIVALEVPVSVILSP